jgi:hypothetical protein
MDQKERRMGKDRREAADNTCLCASDPWRYNHLKVVGDIEKISQEQTSLWSRLDNMVTLKVFGLFMTILTTVLIAFCASMYDTNRQTLAIVTKINKSVAGLEASRDLYGFRYPDPRGSFCGDKSGKIGPFYSVDSITLR